jgi:hypothetical protein
LASSLRMAFCPFVMPSGMEIRFLGLLLSWYAWISPFWPSLYCSAVSLALFRVTFSMRYRAQIDNSAK